MEIAARSFWPAVDRSWKSIRLSCDNSTCHNTQLMRTIPGGRPGVRMSDCWYCSIDCFVEGCRSQLSNLTKARSVGVRREPRMSLGLVLVSSGQLTPDQLRCANSACELRHERLEDALLRLNYVSEKQLAAARAAQWGYPLVAQDAAFVSESDIPSVLMDEFSAVPLQFSEKAQRILVGFVFRVEYAFLESIEAVTGYKAVPCFISASHFKQQMDRVKMPAHQAHVFVSERRSPERMSLILGQYGNEVGMREVVLSQCGNLLWGRLIGKKRKIDVVFRLDGGLEDLSDDRANLLGSFRD